LLSVNDLSRAPKGGVEVHPFLPGSVALAYYVHGKPTASPTRKPRKFPTHKPTHKPSKFPTHKPKHSNPKPTKPVKNHKNE